MTRTSLVAIAVTEAAYDIEAATSDWLPLVMDASLPLLDRGLGVVGIIGQKPPDPGPLVMETVRVAAGSDDFLLRLISTMQEFRPEEVHRMTDPGVWIVSDLARTETGVLDAWKSNFQAEDGIGLIAIDTDGRAIGVLAPTPERMKFAPGERRTWEMMAAHLSAGLRLRLAIAEAAPTPQSEGLPKGAEAVIDPRTFKVAERVGRAKQADAAQALRDAAIRIDRARGPLRDDDPQRAIETWWALNRGRWSIVDWFDTDERRFVLAIPNPPHVKDPRGLTERECQVAGYAALGESHKMIAYRLGISRPAVSKALGDAKRKLGVRTQAQLVAKLRHLGTKSL